MTQALRRFGVWCSAGALVALALAACGGGGGSSDPDPDPVTFTLDVAVSGSGSVGSAPVGIDCGSTCSAVFASTTTVTLTATPATGQRLQGWDGACAGQAATCSVTMDAARSVSATFVPTAATTFTLGVSVVGSGAVSSQPVGISCGSSCSANYAAGASVVLTATPAQGQLLSAWSGACTGQAATCTVAMNAARTVTATFAAAPPQARAWGTAALLESSNDFNVAGTGSSSEAFTLTAIDAAGNALVVWEQSDGAPDGNTRKVFSRRYVAGQGWAPAVVVPGLSTETPSVVLVTGQLLMDATGNATWVRHNFETRRYGAAAGWSATAFVPPAGVGGLVDAKVDAGGNVHLLGYGGGELRVTRLPSGGTTWEAWADPALSDLATPSARLALDSSGGAIAVWRERNPGDGNYSMKANRRVNGAWQTPVRIEEVLTDVTVSPPEIEIAANGNAIAAWHQGSSLYVNRFNAATASWGVATEVDAGQVTSNLLARIEMAMLADGRAVLTWQSGTYALKSMSYSPSTGFSAPLAVTSLSTGNHFLGIDRDGRALLTYRSLSQWPNPTDATYNVYTRELPSGGAWSAAALIETGAGDTKQNVPCAMNLTGQAVCTWAQNDLAGNTIRNSLWANLRR